MYKGILLSVTFDIFVPKYSVCNLTVYVVRIQPVNDLAASSFLTEICRFLIASSVITRLIVMTLLVLRSVVNSDIVRVFTVSIRVGTGSSLFPLLNASYLFLTLALFEGVYPLLMPIQRVKH